MERQKLNLLVAWAIISMALLLFQGCLITSLEERIEEVRFESSERENERLEMLKFSSEHLQHCSWISKESVDFGVWEKNEKKEDQFSQPLIYKR